MSLNQRISATGSIYPAGMPIFVATILIVLGLGFEAVEVGWAQLLPHGVWLFSVIVPGLWNMLAVQWSDPVWRELLRIAPLGLVAIGMMILLVQKRAYSQERSARAHSGDNQDA